MLRKSKWSLWVLLFSESVDAPSGHRVAPSFGALLDIYLDFFSIMLAIRSTNSELPASISELSPARALWTSSYILFWSFSVEHLLSMPQVGVLLVAPHPKTSELVP